jgi:Bacterial Ig domain
MRRRLLPLLLLVAACAALPASASAAPTVGINAAGVPVGGQLDAALATGAREVRMFLLWRDLEPDAKGRMAPHLVTAYTDIVARLSAAGVRPNFVFTGSPQWASGSANPNVPPRDVGDYADALARFAALPGIAGHSIAYELWNEEDSDEWWAPKADPAGYAALVKAAAPALRAADPSAQVVLGPLTGSDFPWLEQLYANGIQGSFDAAAVHLDTACLVTGPATFFRDENKRISQYVFLGVREVLATMRAHGDDKPLRVTEFGWTSTQAAGGGGPSCERGSSTGLKPSGVTPADQATFLAQGYHCLAQEPGIQTATWFTLDDAPTASSPLDELRHYGLLTAGGGHKPAWDAFRTIATAGDALSGQCGDFDGPAITVVTPKVGQSYAGALRISASATDAGGPKRVTFAADGKTIQNFGAGLANGKVVSLDWQGAKQLGIGTHTITVSATDTQGNEAKQDVQVRKVSATDLIAIGPAKFTLKGVKCSAAGVCSLAGGLKSPSGSPLPGKLQIQWQWRTKATKKKKAAWKTLHKVSKPAGKPFKVKQKLKRSGAWRVRVRYLAPKPLKASSSPWAYFSVKIKKKR